MANLNKVTLMGNLGGDPEQSEFDGGVITLASLATNEHWNDRNGETQAHTEWHNLVFFGKLAEIAKKYLVKGSPIFIEGRLRTRKWKDSNGTTRYATQINVEHLQMLGKKNDQFEKREVASAFSEDEDYDDDIMIDEYHVSDREW